MSSYSQIERLKGADLLQSCGFSAAHQRNARINNDSRQRESIETLNAQCSLAAQADYRARTRATLKTGIRYSDQKKGAEPTSADHHKPRLLEQVSHALHSRHCWA